MNKKTTPLVSRQAPTPLRVLVPEDTRASLDEAFHSPQGAFLLGVISAHILSKLTAQEASSEALDKYDKVAWPYLQADSVGYRRGLKQLRELLNPQNEK